MHNANNAKMLAQSLHRRLFPKYFWYFKPETLHFTGLFCSRSTTCSEKYMLYSFMPYSTGLDDVVQINWKGTMVLNLFSFVQFHLHTLQQLKPMGSGSSKKLVLQVYNGGHGEMHFACGASPAAFVFCCISCASLVFLWRV